MLSNATIALLLFSVAAVAADISGTWTGQAPGRGGNVVTQTYTFKVEGTKLTGTVAGPAGELPIVDGKVEGDRISFKQPLNSPPVTLRYSGVVKGDTIEMKRSAGIGRGVTFTLKRVP